MFLFYLIFLSIIMQEGKFLLRPFKLFLLGKLKILEIYSMCEEMKVPRDGRRSKNTEKSFSQLACGHLYPPNSCLAKVLLW